ncbi:putative SOS response-associated peptidase YedK [compost metagenome]
MHDRRPVVLAPSLAQEWMATGVSSEQAEQMALNLGEPAEAFEWYRVGKAVGNVRNQGAELIRPLQ